MHRLDRLLSNVLTVSNAAVREKMAAEKKARKGGRRGRKAKPSP